MIDLGPTGSATASRSYQVDADVLAHIEPQLIVAAAAGQISWTSTADQRSPYLPSSVVVWAPTDVVPVTGSYVKTWAEAVTQVQGMAAPTTIQIYGDPDEDTIVIPGGTWVLNETTLVGNASNANSENFTAFRGYQYLLTVVTAGDPANPCWIQGCVGLKDMFFRQTNFAEGYNISGTLGTFTAYNSSTHIVTFTKGSGEGYPFLAQDVGKPIRIGEVDPWQSANPASVSANNGTFRILSVIDPNTITFINPNGDITDTNNGAIGWSKCTSVFIVMDSDNDLPETDAAYSFTLDNTDFRYGGDYSWGSFFIGNDTGTEDSGSLFVRMMNGASVRWFSLSVDGYLAIESDGSGAWVGSLAFAGAGTVDVFAMAGTQVRTYQNAINSWTLHQPYTVYLPADGSKWSGNPASLHEAIDTLAARVYALEPH